MNRKHLWMALSGVLTIISLTLVLVATFRK